MIERRSKKKIFKKESDIENEIKTLYSSCNIKNYNERLRDRDFKKALSILITISRRDPGIRIQKVINFTVALNGYINGNLLAEKKPMDHDSIVHALREIYIER
jgi:hypothetical protein